MGENHNKQEQLYLLSLDDSPEQCFTRSTRPLEEESASVPPLDLEESRLLLGLCKAGKLYEIEDWIAAGKSLQMAPTLRASALSVVLNTGFHSLIDLIARTETNQDTKNHGLLEAVRQRRWEHVELLLKYGADLHSVPFLEVLESWDPKSIRFFLDNGADAISGGPFSRAFIQRIRTALRPFIEYREKHSEHKDNLQEQIDRALRYFCGEGDLKWISLLMWAGADPRTRGWDLRYEDDPDTYTSAIIEAASGKSLEVIKRLRPDSVRDDFTELLKAASWSSRPEIISYLLEQGAKPNDKPNGGSTGLDQCLIHLQYEDMHAMIDRPKRLLSRYSASRTIACIRLLTENGALWQPTDRQQLNEVRRTLLGMEPEVTLEILKIFLQMQACTRETIDALLHTPRIREHLATHEWHFKRIGVDIRTRQKKIEDAKKEHERKHHKAVYLSAEYDRLKLFEEVWSEPLHGLAKK